MAFIHEYFSGELVRRKHREFQGSNIFGVRSYDEIIEDPIFHGAMIRDLLGKVGPLSDNEEYKEIGYVIIQSFLRDRIASLQDGGDAFRKFSIQHDYIAFEKTLKGYTNNIFSLERDRPECLKELYAIERKNVHVAKKGRKTKASQSTASVVPSAVEYSAVPSILFD